MDASALASAEAWLSGIAIAKLIAAFLVATGVAIEFGGEWISRPFERTVKEAREAEMTKLSADAAEATKAAATANEHAADANERTANLEKEAVDARTEQEHLRANNLALEAQIAPRRVLDADFTSLVSALREFSGKTVSIISYTTDADAFILGRQMISAMENAGISAKANLSSVQPFGGFSIGVDISGKDAEQVLKLAVVLATFARTIVKIRDPSPLRAGSTDAEPDFSILIGVKPPDPIQGVIGADGKPIAPLRRR